MHIVKEKEEKKMVWEYVTHDSCGSSYKVTSKTEENYMKEIDL